MNNTFSLRPISDTQIALDIKSQAYPYLYQTFKHRLYPDSSRTIPIQWVEKIKNEMSLLGLISLLTPNYQKIDFDIDSLAKAFKREIPAITTYFRDLVRDCASGAGHFIYTDDIIIDNKIKACINPVHISLTKAETMTDTNMQEQFVFDISVFDPVMQQLIRQAIPTQSKVEDEPKPHSEPQPAATQLTTLSDEDKLKILSFFVRNISFSEVSDRMYCLIGKRISIEELQQLHDKYNEQKESIEKSKKVVDAIYYTTYEDKFSISEETTPKEIEIPNIEMPNIETANDIVPPTYSLKSKRKSPCHHTKQRFKSQQKKEIRAFLFPLFERGYEVNDAAALFKERYGVTLSNSNRRHFYNDWLATLPPQEEWDSLK